MSGAVQLAAAQRLRSARAGIDARRIADAVLQAKGDKGDKGPKGDTPDHEWQGTKLRFEKPGGEWGELVDLRGEKGGRGSRGAGGGSSQSGGTPAPSAPISPAMTYTGELLTGITYADGSTKALTYASDRVSRIDFVRPGLPGVRKDFSYSGGGDLTAVVQTNF